MPACVAVWWTASGLPDDDDEFVDQFDKPITNGLPENKHQSLLPG